MKLSLIFFIFCLLVLLSCADQTEDELNSDSCPTARRLLFFGGLTFPLVGKKSEHVSSKSSQSSPPKYARTGATHGLTVYIRPQTSSELGEKVHSFSHLLKPKLFTKGERAKFKKIKSEKKKPVVKKKNTTQAATKTRDLVAVNDQERDRCRALLQIDHQSSLIPAKQKKQIKKVKNSISTKVKNATAKAKKQVAQVAKALPVKEKTKTKKTKPVKTETKSTPKEKVKPTKTKSKPSETTALTPPTPVAREVPNKKTATASSPPPPPLPTATIPPVQPATNTKSKREKQPPPPPPVVEESADSLDGNEQDEIENEEKNNSVVGRAYSFVKNMFQLSDDILENNHTHEEDSILSSPTEQSNRQSRKLLSIIDDSNDFSLSMERFFKRQLLSVKTTKQSSSNKKEKTTNNPDAKKPKVGWTYRYRISRYFADQKGKRTGHLKKSSAAGGGKSKQSTNDKKSSNTKVSKRKLLVLDSIDEMNLYEDEQYRPDQDAVDTVTITENFVPKRQLLASKKVSKQKKESDVDNENNDQSDAEKLSERRRLKTYEELTDPAEIVRSYDRGLFKPRVGWQFRYRVSRYIDSLRDNIREDQERLKLGLEAIKRKTPQELSGRRKRVLDKPFTPESIETPAVIDDNKPNVGWRYRYRISKMLDAKQRGEYVDDEELKRQARLGQKQKGQGKPVKDDDECIEWEFDLDPELRKISEEGKRVGWAYRYRIRRKLDELKQRQAETGIPIDFETLGGKREKKVAPSKTSPAEETPVETNKKAVGWQYRYRVSKMLEAQKHETAERSSKSASKKQDYIPPHERLDPVLARLKPEERVVGWQYRYRIRRKLDTLRNDTPESGAGRRSKKSKQSADTRSDGKRKKNKEIIKQVEESIEKILNIDDIDETPFMEYFRRASSYVLFGLLPSARKSICLLVPPETFTFCDESGNIQEIARPTPTSKVTSTKKLRTKKEKQAKQFIQSRPTKLGTTDEIIDHPVKPLSKVPTKVTEKPKKRPTIRRHNHEQVKHYDEEEHPVKKLIGVESKKKNRKRFQIIGQEVKFKPKHTAPLPTATFIPTTTTTQPVVTTTSLPVTTTPTRTTTTPPVVTTATPVVRTTTTTTTTTTTSAPLRTISEIIQEEAATLLTTPSSFIEETKEEINEANEIAQSTTTTTTSSSASASIDSATSGSDSDDEKEEENEETSDDDSSSTDTGSDDSDSESSSNEETTEKNVADNDFDPLGVNKMKKVYENAKESVHGVFDLKDEHNSS